MNYLHPDAQIFLDSTRDAPQLDTQTPGKNREDQLQASSSWGTKTELASVFDSTVRGVNVRVYIPEAAEKTAKGQPAFIYFHGGGWVLGDVDVSDPAVRDIAAASEMVCISVDYRRAPEHPFPAALDDCLAAVDGVLAGETMLGIEPKRIAIGGDSAGGNIAAVIAQERREQIAHQVLVYPVTDLSSLDTPSHQKYEDGYYLTRRRLEYFYDAYAGGADRSNVRMSPGLNPDLAGLPPATVITAEHDPLVSEVSSYARRMLEAGNTVNAVQFNGQVHPFVQVGGVIRDGKVARRVIGTELKAALR